MPYSNKPNVGNNGLNQQPLLEDFLNIALKKGSGLFLCDSKEQAENYQQIIQSQLPPYMSIAIIREKELNIYSVSFSEKPRNSSPPMKDKDIKGNFAGRQTENNRILPKEIRLSSEQERALETMLSGKSLFLTGKAGTGKSTIRAS